MNPLFILTVFTILTVYCVLSIPLLRQRKTSTLQWINLLCVGLFVFLGWALNHLTGYWVILYVVVCVAGYWISASNHSHFFPPGQAILTMLISSMALYIIQKATLLFSLKQGWLGYTATVIFSIGEIAFLLLLIIFAWNTIRAINIHFHPQAEPPNPDSLFKPSVSIHLPICNEPVDVVCRTLHAIARQSYLSYEVLVVDNNTEDPALWMPVKACCEQLGFCFIHVDSLPGYKAGALNLALANTSSAADLVAVVDADYELSPDFLKDNVAAFGDSDVAFLQTAQRSRNSRANPITRMFNPVYDYFYDVTMLSRGQRNSSIFAGCAGLIRLSALREVGGWAEWSITEDAELSLRLLKRGFKGIFVNLGYGTGLLPETFEDVRRQWFRYFFGGLEIASRHIFSTILARNQLSFMQRVDFVMGGMIVLGAAIMLLSSMGIIITALGYSIFQAVNPTLANDLFYWLKVFSNWLIIFTCFQVFGAFLLYLVFRLMYHLNWADSFSAAGAFISLMTTQARAALWVLRGKKKSFSKTPKQQGDLSKKTSFRPILLELCMCLLLGMALFCLFWTAPSKSAVLGHMVLGFWQILIYSSTVRRAFLSPSRTLT